MSNQPGSTPAGFYPAEGGRMRYWNGSTWTDRYQDAEGTASTVAPAKERNIPNWVLPTAVGLVALFVGIGIGNSGKSSGTTGSVAAATATVTAAGSTVTTGPTVTAPPVTVTPAAVTVTYTPPPPGPGEGITDGVWVVGQDIKPGTYRVTAAVADRCYWSITKSGSNGADIVQNDNPTGGFPQVTLKAGQDFTSNRCGTWALKK